MHSGLVEKQSLVVWRFWTIISPKTPNCQEETRVKELVELLREHLIAEGKDGDRTVYHFLLRGEVLEIVI